jgi:hypothetical protein
LQKWGLFETQGTTKGQIGEKLNYSKFLDYYEAAQKAYDECKITQHHLEIVLQKFNDFKVVSNLSIIEELCQNYYGMIHLGVVKITMTEWKNCPINELMQHYEVYKSLSKTKTNQ